MQRVVACRYSGGSGREGRADWLEALEQEQRQIQYDVLLLLV